MAKSIIAMAIAAVIGTTLFTNSSMGEDMNNNKTLIVYFSESGNTQKLAETIHAQIGGDIVRLEPVTAYPTEYDPLADYAKNERDTNARPRYKDLSINISNYDTIFVGYPIWWYTLPMIMYTFFDNNDFSGKTLIPFNTHEGSGDGGTYETIREWEPNATVLNGLAIRGGAMSSDQTDTVNNWLKQIGILK